MSAAQVRSYAAKAEEFAEAASDLEAGRNIAATSLAIHAGINAADAVCGARLGQRAAGEDHDQVLVLLRQAGPDGAEVERELRRLLPLKTKAEYARWHRSVDRRQGRCASATLRRRCPEGGDLDEMNPAAGGRDRQEVVIAAVVRVPQDGWHATASRI